MKGSLEHGADGVAFVGQGLRIALGPAAGIGLTGDAGSGSEVLLGVRAEDVIVSTEASAIVDPGFAPGKAASCIGKVRVATRIELFAPWKRSVLQSSRRVLPLSFGRETILTALSPAQPCAEALRLHSADVHHWMHCIRPRCPLARMSCVEHLVLCVRDWEPGDVEPIDKRRSDRLFIRLRLSSIASQLKGAAGN